MPLLELENVSYYYGNINAVRNINLHVNEGEIVTLIGSNGAGKTTTLQTISGLTSPGGVHGKIVFNGTDIQKWSGHRIAALGIAHCMEGRHVFPKLTVEENLSIGAYLRKDTKNMKLDLKKIYQRFPRLEERKQQQAGTLSGGEQQMLAIGRALISKPKMILMDEPSLGLAPMITKEIFAAIREVNAEGTTILFVEQNSSIALETATRGYVMQVGEIVQEGLCVDLLNDEGVKKAYLGIS